MNASTAGGGIDGPDVEPGPSASPHDSTWTDGADRFAEQERLRQAVQARRRERWRRDVGGGATTVGSALRAAVGAPASVHLCTGGVLQGRVEAVGVDVATFDTADGTTCVALGAIQAVGLRGRPGEDPVGADDLTLSGVLEELRAEGSAVAVLLSGGTVVRGEVAASAATVTLRDPVTGAHVVVDPLAVATVSW